MACSGLSARIFLLLIVAGLLGTEARNLLAPKRSPSPAGCVCYLIYDPVCDTKTGTTYGNSCQAGCANATNTTKGACPCECEATNDPVCADGITYGNACEAKCSGVTTTTPGACEDPPGTTSGCAAVTCTADYTPVCDTATGITYSNQCNADCSGAGPTTPGECQPPPAEGCNCATIYAPVCADGQTYSNQCNAECAGHTTTTAGACKEPPSTSGCAAVLCPPLEDPICVISMDGDKVITTTYVNPCLAACSVANPLGSYLGKCVRKADAKCASTVVGASLCVSTPQGANEYPSFCYAEALKGRAFLNKATITKGQCFGDAAVQLASRPCPDPENNPVAMCFADPCSVSSCPANLKAVCVAFYCNSFFRYAYVGGPCTAVYIDPVTGNLAQCEKAASPPGKAGGKGKP